MILLLIVTFGNLWIWRVVKENFILAILLIILSLLLFKLVIAKMQKSQLLILILVFALTSFITLRTSFDKNIFIISAEEIVQQNVRHGYYAVELGQLFQNKISLQFYKYFSRPIYKTERNIFYNLDPNVYFFVGHPRERAGIEEFDKYPWFLLPFFIAGVFLVIRYNYPTVGIYFICTILISMFLSSAYSLGPVLFFPLINILITLGLIYFLRLLKMRGFRL